MTSEPVSAHNLEAERAVLGTVLATSGKALDTIAAVLQADEFYREAHRDIYAAQMDLYEHGSAVDFITLQEALIKRGCLEAVGGAAYVASLADGVPRATNVEHYARIVRDKAALRNLEATARRLLEETRSHDADAVALVDSAEQALLALSYRAVPGDLVSASQMEKELYPVLEKLQAEKRPVTGLSTGLVELDRYTRGLQRGDLIIVGGRPSQGKTSLAVQLALHCARSVPVAFFSLEMSRQALGFRAVTMIGRVDGHRMQCGQLSDDDQERVGVALNDFAGRRFWVDDTGTLSAFHVRSKARRLKAKHGLGLLVVDYLQLMHHPPAENQTLKVAATTRLLKQIARELDVPFIVLSQLSRKVEDRSEKRPNLADLRESGAIEQDADLVLLIHKPPPTKDGLTIQVPPVELIIAKQRNGPTADIELHWIEEQMRFGETERRYDSRP